MFDRCIFPALNASYKEDRRHGFRLSGGQTVGCESPQWACRLCLIDLSRGSYNPSNLLIASHHDYWLKYEGGILDSRREAVYYTHWGWWSSYRRRTLQLWAIDDLIWEHKAFWLYNLTSIWILCMCVCANSIPTTWWGDLYSYWWLYVIVICFRSSAGQISISQVQNMIVCTVGQSVSWQADLMWQSVQSRTKTGMNFPLGFFIPSIFMLW